MQCKLLEEAIESPQELLSGHEEPENEDRHIPLTRKLCTVLLLV